MKTMTLLMLFLVVSPFFTVLAQEQAEVDLKEKGHIDRVEVFYSNTPSNNRMAQALGLEIKGHAIQSCNQVKKGACVSRMGELEYIRWGTLDLGAMLDITGSRFDGFHHAKLALMEVQAKNGWYATFAELSFLQDTELKYLKFQIPLAFLTGKGLEINVTESGSVQIFIQAEIGAYIGMAKFNEVVDDAKNPVNEMLQTGLKANLVTGVRLFRLFEISGFTKNDISLLINSNLHSTALQTGNGIRLGLTIPQPILPGKLSFYCQGINNQFLYSPTMLDQHELNHIHESYWEATSGLIFEF